MTRLAVLVLLLAAAAPATAAAPRLLASQALLPLYAPDGRHIAYTTDVGGQGRLFELDVVDARTKRISALARSTSQLSPTWSSDGRIAYSSGGALWKASARGTGRYRVPSARPALAPAWRPHSEQLAYLTSQGAQGLDVWVGPTLWAKGAIGAPAWSPDGSQLAFARSGSVWVSSQPLVQVQVAATGSEPGPPVWSPDGTTIAYTAGGRVYTVPADASAPPRAAAGPFRGVGRPAWTAAGDALAYPVAGGVELTTLGPPPHSELLVAGAGDGVSFAPGSRRVLAYAGPVPGCPGHQGIRLLGGALLAGSCRIVGTARPDVIEGTPSWGDVVLAGAGDDSIHVSDGHTDRVDCGPGRDTVWADRTDRLVQCEVVHR